MTVDMRTLGRLNKPRFVKISSSEIVDANQIVSVNELKSTNGVTYTIIHREGYNALSSDYSLEQIEKILKEE